MGGCASRPKDADFKSEDAPIDAPVTPTKAEVQSIPQEEEDNTVSDESEKKEEPLVDVSDEPKEQEGDKDKESQVTESQKEEAAKDED